MKCFSYGSILLLVPLLIVPFSCKPASFEYIGAKKRSGNEDDGKPVPSPNDQTTTAAAGSGPEGNVNGSASDGAGPVAWVEIIGHGIPINETVVNSSVIVRPTKETVDGDDKTNSSCLNAGITKVNYDFGDGKNATVVRSNLCDPLDAPHVYTSRGTYTVLMTVFTAENETASATTKLIVGVFGGSDVIVSPGQNPPKPEGTNPGQLPGQSQLPSQNHYSW